MRLATRVRLATLLAVLACLAGVARGAVAQARPAQPGGAAAAAPGAGTGDVVVLVHGLGRTSRSMRPLERRLRAEGYRVVNVDYPSTRYPVEELSARLGAEVERCCRGTRGRVHFVTHSLGGILVRRYLAAAPPDSLGRVVMLSPPNQGSEIPDRLAGNPIFRWTMGPAGMQLGTDTASVPLRLPPVAFELGVITGDRTLNPLFSAWIPGPDDGKVGVRRARVDGMRALVVVPHTHTFIMAADDVADHVVSFLATGRFR